jgi:8-oxo-dGTP pyrophosphatase MutT (NUDIX family)
MWQGLGTTLFWLVWPVTWLSLRRSTRTRLLIVVQDEVLVTMTWLSDGRWSLPGGGLHSGEDPVDGMLRELREETSIVLGPADIQFLTEARYRSRGLRFHALYFIANLPSKPNVRLRKLEMSGYMWTRIGQITHRECAPDVLTAIRAGTGQRLKKA